MREAERGLLNSSYTAPSAADDVEAPRPESPSPARTVDALSLFLPGGGRGGNEPQGRRWWVWTVVFITVFALALGGVATGVVCFASDGRVACPTCAKDQQGSCLPNPKLAKLNSASERCSPGASSVPSQMNRRHARHRQPHQQLENKQHQSNQ